MEASAEGSYNMTQLIALPGIYPKDSKSAYQSSLQAFEKGKTYD